MQTIRVVIVDDHPVYAQGLRALVADGSDIEVVGICHDGAGVAATIRHLQPDVVVLDAWLRNQHSAEIAQEIKVSTPGARVLVLSETADDASVVAMVSAGAAGYLLKDAAPAEVAQAIRLVAAGESCLAPPVARILLERLSQLDLASLLATGHDQLTERERDVLGLIAQGESNKQIARRLALSTRTAEHHVYSIFRKLGVRDRTQATIYALREGLVEISADDRAQSDWR